MKTLFQCGPKKGGTSPCRLQCAGRVQESITVRYYQYSCPLIFDLANVNLLLVSTCVDSGIIKDNSVS